MLAKVLGRNYTEQLCKRANQSNASVLLVSVYCAKESKRKPDAIELTAGRLWPAQRIA